MARNKSVKEKVQENTDRLRDALTGSDTLLNLPGVPLSTTQNRSLRYLATTMTPAQIRALESVLGPLPVDKQPTE